MCLLIHRIQFFCLFVGRDASLSISYPLGRNGGEGDGLRAPSHKSILPHVFRVRQCDSLFRKRESEGTTMDVEQDATVLRPHRMGMQAAKPKSEKEKKRIKPLHRNENGKEKSYVSYCVAASAAAAKISSLRSIVRTRNLRPPTRVSFFPLEVRAARSVIQSSAL